MSNVVYFHERETNLAIASQYKYLGLVLNEFLDLGITANILSDSAGRALGALIAKTQNLTDLGFKTYLKLFNTGVLAVLNYGAEIWGFQGMPVVLVFKIEQLGIILESTNLLPYLL